MREEHFVVTGDSPWTRFAQLEKGFVNGDRRIFQISVGFSGFFIIAIPIGGVIRQDLNILITIIFLLHGKADCSIDFCPCKAQIFTAYASGVYEFRR